MTRRIFSTWTDRRLGPRRPVTQWVPRRLRPLAAAERKAERALRDVPPPPSETPWAKRRREYEAKPKYRVELKVEVEGYAEWHTDGDPYEETEDDDVAGELIEQVLDGRNPSGFGPDVDRWGDVEQWYPEPTDDNPRAGHWGKVDREALERRLDRTHPAQREPREICASRGPRIGSNESKPRCKLPLEHIGVHRSDYADGFGYVAWGDPANYDLEFRADWLAAGLHPMSEEAWSA